MAKTVTKTWSKAGSDPGQKIVVTVKFASRNVGTVKVDYTIKATSLGKDDMTAHRYNEWTLNVGGTSKSGTYKLPGNKASKTIEGTLTIKEVKGSKTSLTVKFKNARKKEAGDSYSSKLTTGVIESTTLDSLTIDAGPKYEVKFDAGYTGSVSNVPSTMYCYCLESITIPSTLPTDTSGGYKCSGYSTTKSGNPNTSAATVKAGGTFSATADTTLYGAWGAEAHLYTFYTDSSKSTMFPSASEFTNPQSPLTGASSSLPNLTSLYSSTSKDIYKKDGYTFGGWNYTASNGRSGYGVYSCSETSDVDFYPNWYIPVNYIDVKFDYGYSDRIVNKTITQGSSINLSTLLTDDSGATVSADKIRTGYKLLGWSTTKQDPFPADEGGSHITYKVDETVSFSTDTTLYGVWEYYSTMFVKVDGDFKPAIPYVYKNGKWLQATTYVFTNGKYHLI